MAKKSAKSVAKPFDSGAKAVLKFLHFGQAKRIIHIQEVSNSHKS